MRGRARVDRHPVAQGDYKSPSKRQQCACADVPLSMRNETWACTEFIAHWGLLRFVLLAMWVHSRVRAAGPRGGRGADGVQSGERNQTSTAEVRAESRWSGFCRSHGHGGGRWRQYCTNGRDFNRAGAYLTVHGTQTCCGAMRTDVATANVAACVFLLEVEHQP